MARRDRRDGIGQTVAERLLRRATGEVRRPRVEAQARALLHAEAPPTHAPAPGSAGHVEASPPAAPEPAVEAYQALRDQGYSHDRIVAELADAALDTLREESWYLRRRSGGHTPGSR